MSVSEFLQDNSQQVEAALEAALDQCVDTPPALMEAMRYSLLGGGKRLRPTLALSACELVCGDENPAIPAACAVEMVHCYSLIHDDLPAMDDDDMRRGKPSSHKRFDEATAILAGDALLTLAFQVLAQSGDIRQILTLAKAAGPEGMVGGQILDMQAEGMKHSLESLGTIHACKTGALIRASLELGALAAGAQPDQLAPFTAYGTHLGMLFQITDDILDVEGDAELLGKHTGKDAESDKATYPLLLGMDKARRLAEDAADQAREALTPFGERAKMLHHLVLYILHRNH